MYLVCTSFGSDRDDESGTADRFGSREVTIVDVERIHESVHARFSIYRETPRHREERGFRG